MHAIVTPTLGGLALFFGFIGGLGLSSLLFPELFVSSEAAGIAIGARRWSASASSTTSRACPPRSSWPARSWPPPP